MVWVRIKYRVVVGMVFRVKVRFPLSIVEGYGRKSIPAPTHPVQVCNPTDLKLTFQALLLPF